MTPATDTPSTLLAQLQSRCEALTKEAALARDGERRASARAEEAERRLEAAEALIDEMKPYEPLTEADCAPRPDLHALADRWAQEAANHRACEKQSREDGIETAAYYHEAYADACSGCVGDIRECLAAPPPDVAQYLASEPPTLSPDEQRFADKLLAGCPKPVSPPAPSSVARALPDGWEWSDDKAWCTNTGATVEVHGDAVMMHWYIADEDQYERIPLDLVRAVLAREGAALESAEALQPAPEAPQVTLDETTFLRDLLGRAGDLDREELEGTLHERLYACESAPTPSVGDPLAPLVDEAVAAHDAWRTPHTFAESDARESRLNAAIEALRKAVAR